MVRLWHCLMSITMKQLLGLAAESRCTASCTPYEMPEEIFEWSETRNVTRPLSAYSSNTKQMKRMTNLHPTKAKGTYAMQITISHRGSSRRNRNEDWEDAQQMRETTTARAENRVMTAGMYGLVKTGHWVCMPAMRHLREPYEGTC